MVEATREIARSDWSAPTDFRATFARSDWSAARTSEGPQSPVHREPRAPHASYPGNPNPISFFFPAPRRELRRRSHARGATARDAPPTRRADPTGCVGVPRVERASRETSRGLDGARMPPRRHRDTAFHTCLCNDCTKKRAVVTSSSGTPSSGVPSSGTTSSGIPSSGNTSSGIPSSGMPSSGSPSSGGPSSGRPSSGKPRV